MKHVGVVDMGTLTWRVNSPDTPTVYYTRLSDIKPAETVSGRRTGFLCAEYVGANNTTASGMEDKTMYRALSSSANPDIVLLKDSAFKNDVAGLTAFLSGVMLYYELATPEVTDISDILSVDNYIEVEGGGSLTFENEYKYDVPSGVTFVTKEVSE